jgi:hypothetical protein
VVEQMKDFVPEFMECEPSEVDDFCKRFQIGSVAEAGGQGKAGGEGEGKIKV